MAHIERGTIGRHLIVYAKRPLPGHAKTRLGADLGREQSAGVYARLLYGYLLDLARADMPGTSVELSLASRSDVAFFVAAFPEWTVRSQIEGDLGQRMQASFQDAFDQGARSVVLTGSDIPGLNAGVIRAAFQALEVAPAVIGPAADGGYYLIGMRAPGAPLFANMAWSRSQVLAQTEVLAQAHGLTMHHLETRADLDTKVDYRRWQDHIQRTRQRKETE